METHNIKKKEITKETYTKSIILKQQQMIMTHYA